MEQNTTNKPLRRVGTLTLGVCLIAAGTLFLLARFLPGLPWLVIWQVLPAAGLILLGCEVLYYSARPGAPAVFVSTSVISERPTAKIYCIVSNKKLVPAISMNFTYNFVLGRSI